MEWQTEWEVQTESRERRSQFGVGKMRLLSLEMSKCDKNSKYLIKIINMQTNFKQLDLCRPLRTAVILSQSEESSAI